MRLACVGVRHIAPPPPQSETQTGRWGVHCALLKLAVAEEGQRLWSPSRSTTRHTWLFSVASGDRQVHFGSRGYCGRHDARANSLRAGLQPFAWRSGIGVTRCAPAEERAHTVLGALSQNSTGVLESMNAASTTHLLLWHFAVVTLVRLSDPHGELPADGGSQSGTGKRADLARVRSWNIAR